MLYFSKTFARWKISVYAKIAAIIITIAVLIRLVLISQNWPISNSDESTMGLMALHIMNHREHPVFFYGQYYMGSLEAFLAVSFFHLFGPSTFALRCVLILFFALFLISIYLLTSLLYAKKLALVTLLLLSIGSDTLLQHELLAIGGYVDTLLFGTLVLLIASWLALSSAPEIVQRQRWRFAIYIAWGLAAGLGLWCDLLILPFVLMAALLLIVGCWREWRTLAIPGLLVGLVIGAFPLIYYNLHAAPGQDSLSVLLAIHDADKSAHLPVVNQYIGAFLISLPLVTGVNPSCPVTSGQQITFDSSQPSLCFVEYASWSTTYTVLWICAVLCAVLFIVMILWRRLFHHRTFQWSAEKRRDVMRQFARLMLLASAGLTMFLYAISPNAARWPQLNDRYLIGLLIALPAVLFPLWVEKIPTRTSTRLLAAVRGTLLALIAFLFISGIVRTFGEIPAAQAAYQQRQTLIHKLLQIDAKHIYSDYWTCSNVILQSDEQIICAEYYDTQRYRPYVDIVMSDAHSIYVFPVGSYQAGLLATQAAQHPAGYHHFIFDGYAFYIPTP